MGELKEAVRQRYAGLARELQVVNDPGCCGDVSCCGDPTAATCGASYDFAELQSLGMAGSVSLGCGNPTMLADLAPGEVVLDLGSGGGLDVLLSARRVAPGGHAYGVDMTDEMLALAGRNQRNSGIENATFLKGTIENVPLPDASVDVVISNCVINLAEDKGSVLREAFRVLRSGGRLAVADMVEIEPLAPQTKRAVEAWTGCIAGTIPVDEYRRLLLAAGFAEPDIEIHAVQEGPGGAGRLGSAYIRARRPGVRDRIA